MPTSAAEFDRLLLGSPNSSYLWVQYIAFYTQLTEVDKARQVAERALKAISFRQEEERMNVWVARLNLENLYGSKESLDKVFEEAVRSNDAKTMYMHLAGILQRSNKHEETVETFRAMSRKFREDLDVWQQWGLYLFRRGDAAAAREVLEKSLKSLPKPMHIDIIVKFALLEFKHGEVERGRTIFESVLANYPKRVDLWGVYIDQELRVGHHDTVRALFERVISLNLSTKKMKYFFKRYLEFEKTEGSDDTVAHVKAKAREYIQTKMS